jgi:hypothetical protein
MSDDFMTICNVKYAELSEPEFIELMNFQNEKKLILNKMQELSGGGRIYKLTLNPPKTLNPFLYTPFICVLSTWPLLR